MDTPLQKLCNITITMQSYCKGLRAKKEFLFNFEKSFITFAADIRQGGCTMYVSYIFLLNISYSYVSQR